MLKWGIVTRFRSADSAHSNLYSDFKNNNLHCAFMKNSTYLNFEDISINTERMEEMHHMHKNGIIHDQ